MRRRRGQTLSATLALAASLLISPAVASADVDAGSLRASVGVDPWHLEITDASGAPVLSESRGLGDGPAGTLGFSTAAGWSHATRVEGGGMEGAAYVAQLDTTDPQRGIRVRIEPDREGII
ncbi:MAG TPA: hypothetical protein VH501_00310, partial [Solirubrobacterales bacterium]